MRLVSFEGGFGRLEGDLVIPMGPDLVEFIEHGRREEGRPLALDGLPLLAPVPRPGKIVAVGLNYRDHAEESGQPVPTEPVLFAKFPTSVIGPGDPIVIPPGVDEVDYEAELAVIVGNEIRRADPVTALGGVFGYTCSNDVSSRALQFRDGQWTRGKSVDTFCPLGPVVVTPGEPVDGQALGIRCYVNGAEMQSSSTAQMVFGVGALLSFISQTITLLPGDVVLTGTPPGVGFVRDPPVFLTNGDVVVVEIDGIGRLENLVVAEGTR